jgi:ATP synthase protein I
VLSLAGVFLAAYSTYQVAATLIRRIAAEQAGVPTAGAGPGVGKSLWLATRLGLVLSAPVLVSFFVGTLIDSWLGSSPWGTLLLAALGLVAGTAGAYRLGSALVKEVQAVRPPANGSAEESE